jgi:LCP family protein required for cell wall assembly
MKNKLAQVSDLLNDYFQKSQHFYIKNARNILIGIAIFFLFLVSAFATYGYLTYQRVFVGSSKTSEATPTPKPDEPPPPPVYTFALLGHGDPGHAGGLLTDSIMIIKIDTGLEKIGLISVPRDSWVEIPSSGWEEQVGWKVNAAYAIGSSERQYLDRPEEFQGEAGGGELAKYTLEKIVGFPIDHFVAIDFSGFQKSIDVLGGIDVYVDRSFTDPLYPITGEEDNPCGKSEEEIAALTATLSASKVEEEFTCRYEKLVFTRGNTHMDGETALKFARSRHAAADGGDFNRARRQRAVLLAVRDRVLALDFFSKIIPFLSKLTYNMRTDISLAKMNEFLGMRNQLLEYEIVGIPITADRDNLLEYGYSARGQSILKPKAGENEWQNVHSYIDLIMQDEATAAAEVATASAVVELPAISK